MVLMVPKHISKWLPQYSIYRTYISGCYRTHWQGNVVNWLHLHINRRNDILNRLLAVLLVQCIYGSSASPSDGLALRHRWDGDATSGPRRGTKRISKPLVSDNGQDQNPVLQLSVNKLNLLLLLLLLLTSPSSSFLLLLVHFVLDMPIEGKSPISSLSQAVSYWISRHSSLLHSSSFTVKKKNLLLLGHPTGLFP